MHPIAIAMELHADAPETDDFRGFWNTSVHYQDGDRCLAAGCTKHYRTTSAAAHGEQRGDHGFCPAHARAFWRYGDPEGQVAKLRKALREAVFTWVEELSLKARAALVEAAVARFVPTRSFVRQAPPSEHVEALLDAALAYAEADDTDDAEFLRLSAALDEVALRLSKSTARYLPRSSSGAIENREAA